MPRIVHSCVPVATKLAAALCLSWAIALGNAHAVPAASNVGRDFLQKNCVACHKAEKQKGDVRLDDLTGDFLMEGTRWAYVLEVLRSGEMPPEDAETQPSAAEKKSTVAWLRQQLGGHSQRKPNLGNLVPHDLLFDPSTELGKGAAATAARFWRLSPEAYQGWVSQVAGRQPAELVQPFSPNPERGLKDFAALGRVDEPTTEVLMRNAGAIVEKQFSHELVDGKIRGQNGAVKEFLELLAINSSDPPPSPELLARAVVRQYELAIGRKPDAEEVARYLALYENCCRDGSNDRLSAAKTMLTAILLQTEAVFRSEMGGKDGFLTPRETAGAISAALMHRREGTLFQAAEKGQLGTREEITAQVRRILQDPKIEKPKLVGFFREYFEYQKAPDVFKDQPKDLWHRPDQHVRDTDRLVQYLIDQDKDIFRQMLTTPLAFVNVKMGKNKDSRQQEFQRSEVPNAHNQKGQEDLESLYGLEEWTSAQPVSLAPQTRIGILMQPSWLLAWSENFNNDIVRRGRFIRERLLGGTVPDLPIGVAAMIPDEKHRTLRDRVMETTRNEACWKCHQHMDDLGLPFEQFDHYGRRQSAETVLDPAATKVNVDKKGKPLGEVFKTVPLLTTGKIQGTGDPKLDGPVKDPYEMIQRIADSDRGRQVWLRHVFRYFLGRNETLSDAAVLRQADHVYQSSGGSFRELIVCLLTSDAFLRRVPSRP